MFSRVVYINIILFKNIIIIVHVWGHFSSWNNIWIQLPRKLLRVIGACIVIAIRTRSRIVSIWGGWLLCAYITMMTYNGRSIGIQRIYYYHTIYILYYNNRTYNVVASRHRHRHMHSVCACDTVSLCIWDVQQDAWRNIQTTTTIEGHYMYIL